MGFENHLLKIISVCVAGGGVPPEREKGGRVGELMEKRITKPSLFKRFIMASKTLHAYFKSEITRGLLWAIGGNAELGLGEQSCGRTQGLGKASGVPSSDRLSYAAGNKAALVSFLFLMIQCVGRQLL